MRPISIAAPQHVLYVLHSGDDRITAFDVDAARALTPRADIGVPLRAGAAGAAAIRLSPDGRFLTITERESNTLDTYFAIDASGAVTSLGAATDGILPRAGYMGLAAF